MGTRHQPTARALASWLCALWGWHEGARGGAPAAWVWGVVSQALTHARPLVLGSCGQGPLRTGCWCGGCGRGDPSPTPGRALLCAGLARCRGGTRAHRGGRLLPECGASWVGRSPTPDHASSGRAARARNPLAAVAGDEGVGTRHRPRGALCCKPALRAVGAARGRRRGGVSCQGVGCPGLGAHSGLTACPSGVQPGSATHWLRM